MIPRIAGSNPTARLVFWRRAALFWGIFLLALTSWPSPPSVPVLSSIPDFDKLVHFCLYGVEAVLLYRAVAWPGRPGFSAARVLAIVGVLAVWAIADETHQAWIPGRSMEGWDVIGDVSGSTVGAIVASLWSGRRTIPMSSRGA